MATIAIKAAPVRNGNLHRSAIVSGLALTRFTAVRLALA